MNMALDRDLIGVIIACAVASCFLWVMIVVAACLSYRRLERKRRKHEKHRASNGTAAGWSGHPPPVLQANGNTTDTPIDSQRISGYRPRILSPRSPSHSTGVDTTSTKRGPEDPNGSPEFHQPSTPRHSQGPPPPNGFMLVQMPMAYPYGHLVHTQDFYDARVPVPVRNMEDMETIFYPDQPYHSTVKDHQKGPAPKPPQAAASPHNGNGNGSQKHHHHHHHQQQQQQQQQIHNNNETQADVSSGPKADESNDLRQESTEMNKDHHHHHHHEEGSASSSHYKVIRKQHNHVKMPEWLIREPGDSILMDAEGDTAEDLQGRGDPGMVSVVVNDYSVTTEKSEPQMSDQAGMSQSTVEEGTTSIIQDYSSANYIKDFSILDYVDPPGSQPTDTTRNSNPPQVEEIKSGYDTSIMENKAAVLKQIREKVNESAEKVPPAFTSTPRMDPVADDVETDQTNEENMGRRQRQGDDGSVAVLPPAASDTNF